MNSTDPGDDLRTLTILHAALLIGQVLFAGTAYFLVSSGNFKLNPTGLEEVFYVLVPVIVAGGIVASFAFAASKIKGLRENPNVQARVMGFRSTSILQWALLEGPSFFATAIYIITGSLFHLALAVAVILVFIYIRPTRAKLEEIING